MAHLDIDRFDVRPGPATVEQRRYEISRTHTMLVVTAIATMIIVVVAALFMTMF